MGGGPGDALALRDEGRTLLSCGLAGAGRDRADRGKALPEFVMQLARQMLPLLVLDDDEALRQRVALDECRLEAAGQMIEHVADSRKLGKIAWRQARGKVAGGKALKTGTDRLGRPQGVGERRVNQHAKPDKGTGHDDGEAAGFAPALPDQALRIDRRHGFAVRLVAEIDRMHRLAVRIEKPPIEIGEELRRAGIAGGYAAAQPLQNFSAWRAIGNAKAGRHQRRRYPLQVGELNGRALDPVDLALLQCQVLGDHLGDPICAPPRGAVRLEQKIGRGGGETERRHGGDAQGEPKFQIKPGRGHGRTPQQKGCIQRRERNLEHDPEKWEPVFRRDKREAFARRSCLNKAKKS
jgi:hypothetical protein